jgi:DMSO/TMAO reductase YedYZ molybdopterin-dependent catalytic subunit
VVPWADPPPPVAAPQVVPRQLDWERLDSWLTPNDRFFVVAHYGVPEIDPAAFRLRVGGLVERPLSLTLDEVKARPRREVACTLECSGNHGIPWLTGAIGNARWAGTPLAPLLREAGVRPGGTEVVFYGADSGEEQIRQVKVRAPFARSMSVADARNADLLLCYEMNGAPLPRENGFPLRLVAPGWYGVASVKWLDRVEVRDTRYEGRFMGRDYVTVREEEVGGRKLAVETSVGRALLKSAPARVTRLGDHYRITGAAWGGPVARVEVRIDGGPGRRRRSTARRRPSSPGRSGRWTGRTLARRARGHVPGDRRRRAGPAGDGRPLDRQQAHLLGEQRAGHAARPRRLKPPDRGCSAASKPTASGGAPAAYPPGRTAARLQGQACAADVV